MMSYLCSLQVTKFVNELKHVRFKILNELSIEKQDMGKDVFKQRSEVLSEIMNCNIHTAREILAKDKNFVNVCYYDYHQNAKFCSKYLKLSHIIEYPCLLTLQPSVLQHRYFSLKELGFYSVTPNCILRFPSILKETPISLKKRGFPVDCEHRSDILTDYLAITKRTEINYNLQRMYNDGSDLQKIKEFMNAEYFASKLECSIGKAHQMFHRYTALRVQSIYITDQLLNVLLSRLGLSISKIYSSLYLLSEHHETVENFVSELPEILGVNTVTIIQKLPLLLKQQVDSIQKIEAILKKFNVTNDHLICCPKVLSIAPDTLYKRLTYIFKTEELAVLQSNQKFLWLVYYFKNLNSRLKRLKDENMPCSIRMFTVSKNTFEKYIMFNNTRTSITEAYVYLANVFKMDEKEIYDRLNRYSNNRMDIQNFSVLNCRRVIEFLLLSGVTKEQIFNGLEIVFYEADIVKVYFKNLKNHHACQPFEEWVSNYNLIQLLIYTIEVVEYHCYEKESNEQAQDLLSFSI